MNIAQKIIETHKLKFGSLPPLQQCTVSGSALFNADCMDILLLSSGRIDTNVLGIYAVPKAETLKINININRILHIYLVSNF